MLNVLFIKVPELQLTEEGFGNITSIAPAQESYFLVSLVITFEQSTMRIHSELEIIIKFLRTTIPTDAEFDRNCFYFNLIPNVKFCEGLLTCLVNMK